MNPGQVVRIKTYKVRPSHWNSSGSMDCYMGRSVTISRTAVTESKFKIEEDGGRWLWSNSDIETSNDPNALFKSRKSKT